MRIVYFTQYYPPEPSAAPSRAMHFAKSMRDDGHEVIVVTGMPNHPEGVIYPAYRRRFRVVEHVDGIEVRRRWLYVSTDRGAAKRMLNHLSFAIGSGVEAIRLRRPAVVFVSVPPLFHGPVAAACSFVWRCPFVLDVRDDWPYAAVSLGQLQEGAATRFLERISMSLQTRARRVVAVTPGMRRKMLARGIQESRVRVITNGADTITFTPGSPNHSGRVKVVYAGTHGHVHGMRCLIPAAQLVDPDRVEFTFIGDGVVRAELEAEAERLGISNVGFESAMPPPVLAERLRDADICLATTAAASVSADAIPVKMFDYLSSGCPVIGALTGDAARILEESGGGVLVPPEDAQAIGAAINALSADPSLRREMGEKGASFVRKHYSREALGRQLVGVLREAVEDEARRRQPRPSGVYAVLKRTADIVMSAAALFVFGPLMLLIAAAIRFDSPGPALFKQRRSGRWTDEFVMLKFRTMAHGTPDVATHLLGSGDVHMTRLGRFLRRSSLDELPQFINVLVGHMSIIGPRPALYNQYDLISMRTSCGIDACRPGLTGWAQVNGRDDLPLDVKVRYDDEYTRGVSARFDLLVVWRTIATVIEGRGAR